MKQFPKSVIFSNIRNVFEACGLLKNNQLLDFLGPKMQTRADWRNFMRYLRETAASKKVQLWPRSEETLYWWLSKKKRWMRPVLGE